MKAKLVSNSLKYVIVAIIFLGMCMTGCSKSQKASGVGEANKSNDVSAQSASNDKDKKSVPEYDKEGDWNYAFTIDSLKEGSATEDLRKVDYNQLAEEMAMLMKDNGYYDPAGVNDDDTASVSATVRDSDDPDKLLGYIYVKWDGTNMNIYLDKDPGTSDDPESYEYHTTDRGAPSLKRAINFFKRGSL